MVFFVGVVMSYDFLVITATGIKKVDHRADMGIPEVQSIEHEHILIWS